MKTAMVLIAAVATLFAGSATAISDVFSLGTPVGIIEKPAEKHIRPAHDLTIQWGRLAGGILFKLRGVEPGAGLAIMDLRGNTIQKIDISRDGQAFWNGRGLSGVKSPCGLYIAVIDGRDAQTFVYSSWERDK
jgi:hypothetical protein